MKSVRVFSISIGLLSVLVMMAAFVNFHKEKKIKESTISKGFAVVELFTSEGCSSCPPADELLESIQKNSQHKDIYILAFHVDYWDHQGWKDRFSEKEYSLRQRQYAEWLKLGTVYTPQIVINGKCEYVGSDQGSVLDAISAGLGQQMEKTLSINAKVENNGLNVTYSGTGDRKNTELVLALIQKSAHSSVKAGENSGRNLSHVQIVRKMLAVPLGISNRNNAVISLPADFKEKNWELIGFVQRKTDGQIINASKFNFEAAQDVEIAK